MFEIIPFWRIVDYYVFGNQNNNNHRDDGDDCDALAARESHKTFEIVGHNFSFGCRHFDRPEGVEKSPTYFAGDLFTKVNAFASSGLDSASLHSK